MKIYLYEYVLCDRHATSLSAAGSQSWNFKESDVNQARTTRKLRITTVPHAERGVVIQVSEFKKKKNPCSAAFMWAYV